MGETGGWWREKGGEEKDYDSLIRLPPLPRPPPKKNKTLAQWRRQADRERYRLYHILAMCVISFAYLASLPL